MLNDILNITNPNALAIEMCVIALAIIAVGIITYRRALYGASRPSNPAARLFRYAVENGQPSGKLEEIVQRIGRAKDEGAEIEAIRAELKIN